jgi:hypothetical protein
MKTISYPLSLLGKFICCALSLFSPFLLVLSFTPEKKGGKLRDILFSVCQVYDDSYGVNASSTVKYVEDDEPQYDAVPVNCAITW